MSPPSSSLQDESSDLLLRRGRIPNADQPRIEPVSVRSPIFRCLAVLILAWATGRTRSCGDPRWSRGCAAWAWVARFGNRCGRCATCSSNNCRTLQATPAPPAADTFPTEALAADDARRILRDRFFVKHFVPCHAVGYPYRTQSPNPSSFGLPRECQPKSRLGLSGTSQTHIP